MKNDVTSSDLAEDGGDLYPHLKITAENFPRVLATRRFEDDDAEYFGAFLTKTAVRILIDFVNRTFRLRSCEINVDGSFQAPCTQYFRKRCLAPCVSNLCSKERYDEMVGLVRLFLADRRGDLETALYREIDEASDRLDFEQAAYWRDMLLAVESFWKNPRWQVWLDDAVDTYDADETIAGSFIYLVTQRGRNVLGRKVFRLPRGGGMSPDEALERIIESFYRSHAPREIFVSLDFEGRKRIAADLSNRFGRNVPISLTRSNNQRVGSMRALQNTWAENEIDFLKAKSTPRQISGELKRLFSLPFLPNRVEAFDVAHISGKNFVAASTVWQNGEFVPEEYAFYLTDETSEIKAIGDAVRRRFENTSRPEPDLIVIDGGRAQLNAAVDSVKHFPDRFASIIGAVKPPGRHSSLAYFIDEAGTRSIYESDNPAQNVLRLLRDSAHDLANRVHRDLRDMGHHYELASVLPSLTAAERNQVIAAAGSIRRLLDMPQAEIEAMADRRLASLVIADINNNRPNDTVKVLPFVVPIRFDAPHGNADDLIPIEVR